MSSLIPLSPGQGERRRDARSRAREFAEMNDTEFGEYISDVVAHVAGERQLTQSFEDLRSDYFALWLLTFDDASRLAKVSIGSIELSKPTAAVLRKQRAPLEAFNKVERALQSAVSDTCSETTNPRTRLLELLTLSLAKQMPNDSAIGKAVRSSGSTLDVLARIGFQALRKNTRLAVSTLIDVARRNEDMIESASDLRDFLSSGSWLVRDFALVSSEIATSEIQGRMEVISERGSLRAVRSKILLDFAPQTPLVSGANYSMPIGCPITMAIRSSPSFFDLYWNSSLELAVRSGRLEPANLFPNRRAVAGADLSLEPLSLK